MIDLVFHIGLTKTASSFLQRKVFKGKKYFATCKRMGNWP